jgi:hypothetical protein
MNPDQITPDNGGIPDPEMPTQAVLVALREFLELATEGQQLPPGLDVRPRGRILEIVSDGKVVAQINRAALLERAAEISAARN